VHVEEEMMGAVISDLSQRRAQILSTDQVGDHRAVNATVPLAELVGYASALRTMTRGTASCNMHVSAYEAMGENDQLRVIQSVLGFLPQR
jgi:elongation factor G